MVLRKAIGVMINSACVRKAIGIYSRYQTKRARIKDFEMNKSQVISWIWDEATKAQQRVHGFEISLGTEEDFRRNMLVPTINRVNDQFSACLSTIQTNRFTNWFLTHVVAKVALTIAIRRFLQQQPYWGQTLFIEQGDPKDVVVIYVQRFSNGWTEDHVWDEAMVRSTIRHEFRHAEQVKALREVGGEELVKKVIKHELELPYDERLMEKDAYSGQLLNNYRPIKMFVNEILRVVG